MTTALIYTRVSTEDQAREGVSLDAQLGACREYAARQGWVIGGEFQDVMSGKRRVLREELDLLTGVALAPNSTTDDKSWSQFLEAGQADLQLPRVGD